GYSESKAQLVIPTPQNTVKAKGKNFSGEASRTQESHFHPLPSSHPCPAPWCFCGWTTCRKCREPRISCRGATPESQRNADARKTRDREIGERQTDMRRTSFPAVAPPPSPPPPETSEYKPVGIMDEKWLERENIPAKGPR